MTAHPPSGKRAARYHVVRVSPGEYGWAIRDAEQGCYLTVDGSPAVGITRWEGRQTCGLLGIDHWVES